jgi:hypothetical protein
MEKHAYNLPFLDDLVVLWRHVVIADIMPGASGASWFRGAYTSKEYQHYIYVHQRTSV